MSHPDQAEAVVFHHSLLYREFIGEAVVKASYHPRVFGRWIQAYNALNANSRALIVPREFVPRGDHGKVTLQDITADVRLRARQLGVPVALVTGDLVDPPVLHSGYDENDLLVSIAGLAAPSTEDYLPQGENLPPEVQARVANALTAWLLGLPVK